MNTIVETLQSFGSDPPKGESLSTCDELPWGVFSDKDLIFGAQVILSQKM